MILTGPEIWNAVIRGDIEIDPFVPEHLGENSLDLRLAPEIKVYDLTGLAHLGVHDMKIPTPTIDRVIPESGFVIEPGRLYLGATVERIRSRKYAPCLEGRSSSARLGGLSVHASAGVGDRDHDGTWTLEITTTEAVRVYAGVRICQILFFALQGEFGPGYQGKYNQQRGPRASEIWRDFR